MTVNEMKKQREKAAMLGEALTVKIKGDK